MDFAQFTTRITETVGRLRSKGLTDQDRKSLRSRFEFLWVPRKVGEKSKWRNDTARQAFSDVQHQSAHLFLVLSLLVSPTECGKRAFCDKVITPLLNLKSYEPHHFPLSQEDKTFFEDAAKAKEYLEEPDFTALMEALFPEDDRTFTYAYSKMPRGNLQRFLEILAEALEGSNLFLNEIERGDEDTSVATVLVPAGDVDCSCSITISRRVITEALGPLRLTKVYERKLEPFNI